MDATTKSTAGIRQFEQTAVAKLVAEGVPKHIADAFVLHGLPKTNRTQQIKDQVCNMRYEKFFVERSEKDYDNPLRVGALFPHVVESKQQKFHAEFQMSDIDAARFSKAFPEFDVVARGRTYNQHAYYANKRYAETELLVSMVFRDAIGSTRNPRSLIDFGGNDTWHIKRGRDYVHCDNPVMSARDVMRYKVREIFSSSDREQICNKKFSECSHNADYAIAVHSTYDASPKEIARAMLNKKVKKFFGVINYIPGVEIKPEGTYEADGVVMSIVRPTRGPAYANCGFRHDPSLQYKHRLSVLRKYLHVNKRYDFENPDGSFSSFTYSVQSVRGNSLIYQICEGGSKFLSSDALWSPPTRRLYYLSLTFLGVHRMEVDSEFFDRLVFHAVGIRNIAQNDIMSLFRYAKSLRQRVSINNIVLSSGFTQTPEELVNSVIAAYATASAYRVESGAYFKKASSQISSLRNKSFFRDVFEITAAAVGQIFFALPALAIRKSRLLELNERIKRMVAAGGSVNVEVYKPHAAQGIMFQPEAFVLPKALLKPQKVLDATQKVYTSPLSILENMLPTYVECDGFPTCFYSKGLLAYDSSELPRASTAPVMYKFEEFKYRKTEAVGSIRQDLYKDAMTKIANFSRFDTQAVVLRNGDRVYRKGLSQADASREPLRDDVPLTNNKMQYIVFRGVGDKAVSLTPPAMYQKGVCLAFVLFFYKRSTYATHESNLHSKGMSSSTANDLPESAVPFEERLRDQEVWEPLTSQETLVRSFGSPEQGTQYMNERLEAGEAWMSGALPASAPLTPDSNSGSNYSGMFVRDYNTAFAADPSTESNHSTTSDIVSPSVSEEREANDVTTVQSDDIVQGVKSLNEMITLCNKSEQVSVASSKVIIDLAVSAARGDVPLSRFRSVAQGHPGDIKLVDVRDGKFIDMVSKDVLPHMAVSDGERVYDKITNKPPDGIYVTSDEMRVYTGAAIKDAIAAVINESHQCPVNCVNGVAGSGKSYYIEHHAKPGDVVLCETREALADVARGLHKIPDWRGHAYTVDAFLMHTMVKTANTLWIDEAFRLHAAKIFAVMKILKPKVIYCFGDKKQIPVLPFVPQFEFVYHEFPFTSFILKRDTYRCPADVCFALSTSEFYGFQVLSHNPILRSIQRPKQFVSGMFDLKPKHVPLLVYTQTCKEDLHKQGVTNVLTIGESQGKTYDEVILFRDTTLPKDIYFNQFQTLVAVTRHRKKFTYVTVDTLFNDGSGIAKLCQFVFDKGNELLLSSHLAAGVRGAEDAAALEARQHRPLEYFQRQASVSSVTEESTLDVENWADFMDDIDSSL